MSKNSNKANKNVHLIVIAIIFVVIIAALIFVVFNNKNKAGESTGPISEAEQQQIDNSNKLATIQAKIDAQQKIIDDLNGKLTPLIEERTQLEKQLIEIKTPKPVVTEESQTDTTEVPEEMIEMPQEPVEDVEE